MKKIFGFLGALILSFGISFDTQAMMGGVKLVNCVFYGSDWHLSYSDNSQKIKTEIIKRIFEFNSGCSFINSTTSVDSYDVEGTYNGKRLVLHLWDTPTGKKYASSVSIKLCSGSIVVYVCTSDDVEDLKERLTLVQEKIHNGCKVILVAPGYNTIQFINSNISTVRGILGERLVEPQLVVDPVSGAGISDLSNLIIATAVKQQENQEQQNSGSPTATPLDSEKTCLLL